MISKFTVRPEYDGQRLTNVLAGQEAMSATLRKRIRLCGQAEADGRPLRLIDPVRAGQEIRVDDGMPDNPGRSSLLLPVLYEDDWFLAVNKPPGMITHPAVHPHDPSVLELTGGSLRAVGRLDKDTSGVMLLAKNAHAHHFSVSHPMRKLYLGLCHGLLQAARVTVDGPICRSNQQYLRRVVRPDGKPARTKILLLSENRSLNLTLAAFRLDSGRTHQIRVHALYNGNPLLGDWLYGLAELEDIYPGKGIVAAPRAASAAGLFTAPQWQLDGLMTRQALHAAALSFVHPVSRKRIRLEAPPPADFTHVLSRLSETALDDRRDLGLQRL